MKSEDAGIVSSEVFLDVFLIPSAFAVHAIDIA